MEPSVPDVEKSVFNLNSDWKELYRDVVEDNPHRITETLGGQYMLDASLMWTMVSMSSQGVLTPEYCCFLTTP